MVCIHEKNSTDFNTLGLGMLSPSFCIVKEELNGLYELEMEHPYDEQGKWKRIEKELVLYVSTPTGKQPFRIYHIKPDIKGIKVYARHVFYDLLDNLCLNINENSSPQAVLNAIKSSFNYSTPFTFTTNMTGIGKVVLENENPVSALLGIDEDKNSFVKAFGGEVLRDGFTVTMRTSIGQDRGVAIRYGKNLVGLEVSEDISKVATRILPIGKDGLQGSYVDSQYINSYVYPKIYIFEDSQLTTKAELQQAAQNLLNSGYDLPTVNIKVDFQTLSKTEEYKEYGVLENVQLGDIVMVSNVKMGFHKKAKVISYEWDSLLEQYDQVELGDFVTDLTASVITGEKGFSKAVRANNNAIIAANAANSAVAQASQTYGLITGKVTINENGLYICVDGTSTANATKVFHWGNSGLQYSDAGINGTYKTIIDTDGNVITG